MSRYFKYVIWSKKDDPIVQVIFKKVMGYQPHKSLRVDRLTGRRAIGTQAMTAYREKQLKDILGGKIKMKDKLPMFFVQVTEKPNAK